MSDAAGNDGGKQKHKHQWIKKQEGAEPASLCVPALLCFQHLCGNHVSCSDEWETHTHSAVWCRCQTGRSSAAPAGQAGDSAVPAAGGCSSEGNCRTTVKDSLMSTFLRSWWTTPTVCISDWTGHPFNMYSGLAALASCLFEGDRCDCWWVSLWMG